MARIRLVLTDFFNKIFFTKIQTFYMIFHFYLFFIRSIRVIGVLLK